VILDLGRTVTSYKLLNLSETQLVTSMSIFSLLFSLSLRPNFGLRSNFVQNVKWHFWFGLS